MGSLILVRHSLTAAAEAGRNLGQRDDSPLIADGVQLAEQLASAIVAELEELAHGEMRLITSPALRCRQTADPVARALAIDAPRREVDRALLEVDYGDWEGLDDDECHARDPELRGAWEVDPWATACPGGESGMDVAARSFPAFEGIEAWLAQERDRCAIVVAHNHVNRIRLCHHLGWPMRTYRERVVQQPAGYSLLTFSGRLPVIRRLNAAPA